MRIKSSQEATAEALAVAQERHLSLRQGRLRIEGPRTAVLVGHGVDVALEQGTTAQDLPFMDSLPGRPAQRAVPGIAGMTKRCLREPSLKSASCPTPSSCNVNPENGIAQPTIMDHPRITLAPDVLVGKPVIRGTRLSVEFVIGLMADGWSEADILENYPGITHDDILACLAYARDTLSSEKVFPSAA